MLRFRTVVMAIAALLVCAPAFAQGSPTVYVSGGPAGQIYSATPSSSTPPVAGIFASSPNRMGMVFGPDNFLYVCSDTGVSIARFDATVVSPSSQAVFQYTSLGPSKPQCGRFTSTGDLLVSDAGGTGVWAFPGMAGSSTPTSIAPINILSGSQLRTSSFMGAGLTQLHNGDLVVVNQAEHSLYLSVYNANTNTFATPTLLTLSGTLTTPTGIARNSTNELFVADKGSKKIFRLKSASGEFLTSTFSTCAVFSGYDSPVAVQFSADDTLYVATQNSSPLHYPGKVWAIPVTTSGCGTAQVVAKLPQWDSDHDSESTLNSDDEFAQAFGLALPPTATAPQTKSFTNSTTSRNFNFNADTTVTTFTSFQLSNPVPTYCSATLSAIQSPAYTNALGSLKAAVAALISSSALPSGTLVPYLGEAGFGTVYDVSGSPACGSGSVLVGAFTKDLTNPRLIHCHLGIANGCDVVAPNAIYPLSGPIPGDGAVGGKVPNFSQFFVVDVGLSTASGVAGTFCGFNPPLNNTTSPTGAPVFDLSDTGTIPVKFQLGLGANCNKQITNATALLSVARVDSGFTPIIPLKFNGHGGSTATFDVTGKQYHLNLDVTGYAPGTYSVTVTFLSGNAPPVTTYFKLVP